MYLIPNLCTTGNLFCGVFAILSVFNGQHLSAAICVILVGMIFDMLDGKLARLTIVPGSLVLRYDSLSDVVSFGGARCVDLFLCAERTGHVWCSGDVRLRGHGCRPARSLQRHGEYVRQQILHGPGHSGGRRVIASLVIFDLHITQLGAEVKPLLILVITFALAFLMVSTIKVSQLQGPEIQEGRSLYVSGVGHFGLDVDCRLASGYAVRSVQRLAMLCRGRSHACGRSLLKGAGKPVTKVDGPVLDSRE